MAFSLKNLSTARKRQIAVAGVATGVLTVVVASSIYVIESKKTEAEEQSKVQEKERITATDFAAPQSGISQEAFWASTQGAKVDEMQRKVDGLEKILLQNNMNNPAVGPDGLGDPNTNSGIVGLDGNGQAPPPPPSTALPNAGAQPPVVPSSRIQTVEISQESSPAVGDAGGTAIIGNGSTGGSQVRRSADFKQSEQWIRVKGLRNNIEVTEDGGEIRHDTTSRAKFRARDSYIPSGTFFRSVLLGGVDAPTGGDAQNASPHPVLMRVVDFAQLPNRFKYNFRECFVTGQAYGDISAERAYVRLQNLSCVGTDGRAIDMPIKGYVAGEDGKTGIRGTVVTKQGQILANALMAGVIGGLGKGISESFNVTSTSTFGTTTSVGSGDHYKAGIATGIGGAADRLAQYYIKLADKVFPVIEINAGRTVDIVLTKGVEIDTSGETKN